MWAAVMLLVNAAACYIPVFHWVRTSEGTISLWHYMILVHFAIGPVFAALGVLLYSFILTFKNLRPDAETYCELLRTSMLDGVLLPPVAIAFAAYTYPENFDGQCALWLSVMYTFQSVIWMHFFRESRRASLERLTPLLAV
ncbi:hypothetical protein AURDEDRAFT_146636 [Auricularia subglabra TFB-10046 SS5]|nr:hypothetical protein AURDEDRAFT_146636 [Auricularia subglabra TFB-10046 SS5]